MRQVDAGADDACGAGRIREQPSAGVEAGRHFKWVLIGAGAGAAAGAVLGLVTEEICSPGACAYLGGLAGGLIGFVVDRNIGRPRPVERGSFIDDGLGNNPHWNVQDSFGGSKYKYVLLHVPPNVGQKGGVGSPFAETIRSV